MNSGRILRRRMRWIGLAAAGGTWLALATARGQTVTPPSSPLMPIPVTAGDVSFVTVNGLAVNTNLPRTVLYVNSADPTRVAVPAAATQSVAGAGGYQPSLTFSVAGLRRVDGTPDPVEVTVTAARPPVSGLYWSTSLYVTVTDPSIRFTPAQPEVTPGTPLLMALTRGLEANGNLDFTITSGDGSLLQFSRSADGAGAQPSWSGRFDAFRLVTNLYLIGSALPENVFEHSVTATVAVGSYRTSVVVRIETDLESDDPDNDGLPTQWELYIGSNPYDAFSLDPAAVLNDGQWDSDGDGLRNIDEISLYGTDPLRPDTDADGVWDGTEILRDLTNPRHPMSSTNVHERSLSLASMNALVLPVPSRFQTRTNGWTFECWVYPEGDGDGELFSMGFDGHRAGFWAGLEDYRPKVRLMAGNTVLATAGGVGAQGSIQRLPANQWSHVAFAWAPERNSLEVFINGVLLIAQKTFARLDVAEGQAILARGLTQGYLDEVRFWTVARTWEEVAYWHNRHFPANGGYVRQPRYGYLQALQYRFDEGHLTIVDYAHLNDPDYFIPAAAGALVKQPAAVLLGDDDEDGDLLPEWWAQIHLLDKFPEGGWGPTFLYYDEGSNPRYQARVAFYRAAHTVSSVGGYFSWLDADDQVYYIPNDSLLEWDGRFSAYLKYVYLFRAPQSAVLKVYTPGMSNAVAWVNGVRVTAAGEEGLSRQQINVAPHLRVGRNAVVILCESAFSMYLDEARTVVTTDPNNQPWWEGAHGKFDADLVVDGVAHIVRGDRSRNDPRAVWFAQAWSSYEDMAWDPPMPDREMRALPGNGDYGLPFDVDMDQLNALYEFFCGTNPRDSDSNNNGIPDGLEDVDGDGLVNRDEQARGTQPLLPDTDDDGVADGPDEDPADGFSPVVARTLVLGGGAGDYLEFPVQQRFALESWTVEAWVKRDMADADGGLVIQRVAGPVGVNYELGLGDGTSAPVNHPYVRFVAADGTEVGARAAAASGTNWTHLAATYDRELRRLILFVNGAQAASVNNTLASPAMFAGGPVIQRMGAGLRGRIDEARIWSLARTAAQIAASRDRLLAGSEAGLVAYYRFDDGTSYRPAPPVGVSANNGTNGLWNVTAWTWGQVQDAALAYLQDWWNKWTHGATLKGQAAFSSDGDNAVVIPPLLQVMLYPSAALQAGAQWSVEGSGVWRQSGEIVSEDLAAGLYVILFKPLDGWTAPAPVSVTLVGGRKTVIEAAYRQNGALQVTLLPAEAVTNGAQWRIQGGAWMNSGHSLSNLPAGAYSVEFKELPEWTSPQTLSVIVSAGQTFFAVAAYTRISALLTVYLEPEGARQAGAKWRVGEGAWLASGVSVSLVAGSHTVAYSSATGNWILPATRAFAITSSVSLSVTGRYYAFEAYAQGATNAIDVPLLRPRGLTWKAPDRLVIADSGRHRLVEINPATRSLAILGSFGAAAGQFNQPFDVSVNAAGDLFVADANNHRVQQRTRASGLWTVLGGGAASADAGAFNAPFAAAPGPDGSVYVADYMNHRVQRRSPGGAWSVLLDNGFPDGYVRSPGGVTVADSGLLLVADEDYGRYGRIQAFYGGGYVARLGSPDEANGGLKRPRGLATGRRNTVYVADADRHRVMVRRPDGAWEILLDEQILDQPEGVAWDPAGYLYVADTGHDRVLRVHLGPEDAGPATWWAEALRAWGSAWWLPWLGQFHVASGDWFCHPSHGWFVGLGSSPDSVWIWTSSMGWWWTGQHVYPWVYSLQEGAWLWYSVPSASPRWFYHHGLARWAAYW